MVSIIIPACNEGERIRSVISNLLRLPEINEIIVACNGCTDDTPEIAESMNVSVLRLKEKDKGRAVIEGFKAATSDVIGFVDADGAFDSKSVKMVLGELQGCDVVIASKWKGQSFRSVHGSTGRKFAGRIWNLLTNLLFGLNIADTQAGLKVMRKSVFDKIDTNFICTGFAFDVELLYKLKKAGGRIKEIYVPVQHSTNKSSFNILRAPGMLERILKLWLYEKIKRR